MKIFLTFILTKVFFFHFLFPCKYEINIIVSSFFSASINVYHAANGGTGKSSDDYCVAAKNLSQGQLIFIICYTIVRFLYSVILTFTVFFAVLTLFVRNDFNGKLRMFNMSTPFFLPITNNNPPRHGN